MEQSLKEISLRSEEVQEILTAVPNWMVRWGNSLFLILIILVLALSWIVKYPDTIESGAVITTTVPPQKEFAQITAKIDSIHVVDSQRVTENQILAVLENTANPEDVLYLKTITDTLTVDYDSLYFPFKELPLLFLGDIDQSFAVFENNYYQYQLNKRLQPFSNEAKANEISITESKRRLSRLQAQYRLSQTEYDFKKADLNRHISLFEKGVISEQEYENKQVALLSTERSHNSLGVSISQLREAIANANSLAKGTEFSRSREETQLLKSTIQSFNQLKRAIKDWENTYVLKSEIEGKVSFLNYWSKNQTVSQGDLVFTIIPSRFSNYLAKLKAPLLNSGKIKVGQDVNVKLQNYPETEFGMLKGKVHNISLTPDKDGYYLVDVSLPEDLITSYNKKIDFKQEMRGTAEIITEDLRLLERFFYQFKELLNK